MSIDKICTRKLYWKANHLVVTIRKWTVILYVTRSNGLSTSHIHVIDYRKHLTSKQYIFNLHVRLLKVHLNS